MVERRAESPVTPARKMARKVTRSARRAERWMVLRVVLHSRSGEELADPPGRDLLVSDARSFADLADAIDRAFARWDVSHLHEFRLADGRRIGMADTDEFGAEGELDDRVETLARAALTAGDSFEYIFDFGDGWEHTCMVLRDDVDPREQAGVEPTGIVPVFGWGSIPDQYGRVTPDEPDEE